jgi:hypothetical protein
MKMKNILIVSLATNAILLSALAYIQSQSIDLKSTPSIIYFINRSDPESVGTAIKAASLGESATP